MPTIHHLAPDENTVHGAFDRDLPPALTIDSGDTVRIRTLDSAWGLEDWPAPDEPRRKLPRKNPQVGHALTGPIAVRGAKAGMVLEIKINDLLPGSFGWAAAGGFPSYWNKRMGTAEMDEVLYRFQLDKQKMIGRSTFGDFQQVVALRPFMGILGMPPDEPGEHSTFPPRFCGGNLDCKELVPGSTLYLPISVDGALFSVGDGHAVQGDGEVSGPALECPMELVDLTLTVREDMHLQMPRAKTPIGWITLGLHEDLDEAAWIALEGMLELIQEMHGLSRTEAYLMSSLVVDLRVTQIVNRVKGVHAVLPYGAIR